MTDMLPIIEELADCRTHAERVAWLLACPLAILRDHSLIIRSILQRAGFQAGVAYVEAERVALNATRLPDGNHKPGIVELLRSAREGVALAAGSSMEGGQ